jgi:hypothetical protein
VPAVVPGEKCQLATIKTEINRKRRGSKLNRLGLAESARLRGVVGRGSIRDFARLAGSNGGRARGENLSKRQLSQIGRKGARARWQRWRKAGVAEIAG